MTGVQCEMCHGLNREHIADYSKTMRPVTEAVCLRCHTEDHSPDFVEQKDIEKIRH